MRGPPLKNSSGEWISDPSRRGVRRAGEDGEERLAIAVCWKTRDNSFRESARAREETQIARVVDDCPRGGDNCGGIKINYARCEGERGGAGEDERVRVQ